VMHIPPERRSLMWRIMSAGEPEDVLDGIVDKKAAVVTFDVLAAVAWANFMKMFWHAEVEGVPLFALRYNELMEDKRLSLVAEIDYLGFPPVDVSGLLPLFEAHSHEGTRSARTGLELSFTPENDERMRATLAHEKIGLHHNLVL